MKIRVSDVPRDAWTAAVAQASDVPPGALPEVVDALARGIGGGARARAVRVESNRGVALLPMVVRRGLLGPGVEALPFGIAAGPVTLEGRSGPMDVEAIRRALRGQVLELAPHHAQCTAGGGSGARTTHVLDLADGIPSPRKRVRQNIRTAERAGVEVRSASATEIPHVLRLLTTVANERGRRPPPSAATAAVAECQSALLLVASTKGQDVGAALFLHSGYELFYWLAGTLPEAVKHCPSYAILDAAIRMSLNRGCRWVNLGSSDGLPGVAFFKEGFGAVQVPSPVLRAEARRHRVVMAMRRWPRQ
jgi:hypothetical protein